MTGGEKLINKKANKYIRVLLVIIGTCFVFIGIIGIFLPILPTTPFFLLAAAIYAKSSTRFYYWLLHNKYFGSYVKDYREGRGIEKTVKIKTISLLWLSIVVSIFLIDVFIVRVLLLLIAIAVSIHIFLIKQKV